MSKIIHCSQSVIGALKDWTDRDWQDATAWITEKGKPLTAFEIRSRFVDLLASGNHVIPIGQCDNFDPKLGCLGHDNPPSPAAGIEPARAAGEGEA